MALVCSTAVIELCQSVFVPCFYETKMVFILHAYIFYFVFTHKYGFYESYHTTTVGGTTQ